MKKYLERPLKKLSLKGLNLTKIDWIVQYAVGIPCVVGTKKEMTFVLLIFDKHPK